MSTQPSPPASPRLRRVVVTGVTGTLGRHVAEELASRSDVQVLAPVRATSQIGKAIPRVRYERVDFLERNSLAPVISAFQPSAIVHCAATGMQLPRPGWEELVRFNVEVSVRLCELAARLAGCHFVFVGTGLAYRDTGRALSESDALDSMHPYAASKAAADMLVRSAAAALGVPLTVLRPFSFSGPGDVGSRLFPSLLRAAESGQPLDLSPGDQVRDHCAVADIAHGVVLAAAGQASPEEAQVFNLGSGRTVPLRQLVEGLVGELGLKVTLNFGARARTPFEPKYLVADISRARQSLGWQPKTNFTYAIWQLAQESFPTLALKQPTRFITTTDGRR
jgi:nucleoside-diphosphate-sugar epimerase